MTNKRFIREVLDPRRLTQEEIDNTDWSEYTTEEIHHLIDCGVVTNEDIVYYYRHRGGL
jgi:hypothetical protein